ncbi:hypothetical protein KIPB_008795, partial [Kipferlia bialata]
DRYEEGDQLGAGAFGEVFKCTRLKDGKLFACKRVDLRDVVKKDENALRHLSSEISALATLDCPFICAFEEAFKDEDDMLTDSLCIIMELVQGTCLGDILKAKKKGKESISDTDLVSIMCDVLHAMYYCHSKGVLHRDIKPDNIMIDESGERPVAKLIDFGLSTEVDLSDEESAMAETFCGSPTHMSPELMSQVPYGAPSDVWAIGCTFYEMITGRSPLGVCKNLKDLQKKLQSHRVSMLTERDVTVPDLVPVINSMLQV